MLRSSYFKLFPFEPESGTCLRVSAQIMLKFNVTIKNKLRVRARLNVGKRTCKLYLHISMHARLRKSYVRRICKHTYKYVCIQVSCIQNFKYNIFNSLSPSLLYLSPSLFLTLTLFLSPD